MPSGFVKQRLAAKIKQSTFEQTLLKLEKDASTLQNWAEQFHVYASQQVGWWFNTYSYLTLTCWIMITVEIPSQDWTSFFYVFFFGGPSGWLRYEISWRPVHPRKSKVCFDLGVPAYLVVLRFNQPGTWGDCSETSFTWLLYSVSNLNVSMYLFLRWWLISCFWPAH